MDVAKPGDIKYHCDPNALSTFLEYLLDYASPATRETGEKLIRDTLLTMNPLQRSVSESLIEKVRTGNRDVFC
jgi:2-iminoacetate synthase